MARKSDKTEEANKAEEIEKKEEKIKEKKVEKRIVNKQKEKQSQLFSQRELADIFGVSIFQMDSLYLIRGISKDTKLSQEEAYELFKNIG